MIARGMESAVNVWRTTGTMTRVCQGVSFQKKRSAATKDCCISQSCLNEMTETVWEIYETDLKIKKDHIYVKYEEAANGVGMGVIFRRNGK